VTSKQVILKTVFKTQDLSQLGGELCLTKALRNQRRKFTSSRNKLRPPSQQLALLG
jgi:hypothetical protein